MQTELTQLIADVKQQALYLQDLGVESFEVNLSEVLRNRLDSMIAVDAAGISQRAIEVRNAAPEIPDFSIERNNQQEVLPKAGSRLSSLPSLAKRPTSTAAIKNREALKANIMLSPGLEGVPIPSAANVPVVTRIVAPGMPEPKESIEQIRAEIGPDCTRCKLSQLGRTQVVNSSGNCSADLMFCGEAPGADEDEQGFPFVGRAGQLLTKIIESIGISRDDVFIGNINRCRPPANRAPEPDETSTCRPFLQREIAVVRPRVIVVLGATAAHNLLETKVPIGKLRGQFHDYLGTKVMPTFHPAYLLRDPHKKREVWDDMKMVRDYLNGAGEHLAHRSD